jgi:hypothetical protein
MGSLTLSFHPYGSFTSAARLGQVRRPPDHTGTKRGAPSGLPRTLLSDLAISVFAAVEYAVFVPRPSGSSGGKIGTSLNTYSVCVGHTAEVLAADDLLGRGYTLTRPLTIGLPASSVSYDVRPLDANDAAEPEGLLARGDDERARAEERPELVLGLAAVAGPDVPAVAARSEARRRCARCRGTP